MKRQTKILCTLGPASQKKDILIKMCKAGMDMARLNFSHGTHAQHQKVIDTIRTINKTNKKKLFILQDLEGYRIRIGHLKKPIVLEKGKRVSMACSSGFKSSTIPLDVEVEAKSLKKGMLVYVDDGNICLKVLGATKNRISCEVLQGGLLKSRKGVNIPELKLQGDILTEKDKKDLEIGILNQVDFVAQSFVRNKQDIMRVVKLVKSRLPKVKVIAKIENHQGVRNIESIADACDGIMVARGDLGVSLPIYKIPIIQKGLIRLCMRKKKSVITATQMLESMTEHARPTRAEVSDVANAIIDGTDVVMLSGETAVGRFPVGTVEMMCNIIKFTERSMSSFLRE